MISEVFRRYGLSKPSSQLSLLIISFVIIDINVSIKIIALLNCQIYISLVDLDWYIYVLGVYYRPKIMN